MLDGNPRQYPNLVRYLGQLSRRPVASNAGSQQGRLLVLFGIAFILLGFGHLLPVLGGIVALAVGIAAMVRTRPRPLTAEEEFVARTKEAGATMRECLDKRRLHRDLDLGSLALLEECAHLWSRIQRALDSPQWRGTSMPLHYQAVRDQALRASDQAMGEILVLFRDRLPAKVTSRPPLDFVEEAVEKFVLRDSSGGFLSPEFSQARAVAEKLRALATEAESISATALADPEAAEAIDLGRGLDLSIGEMRNIREAEEELRQNLSG